MSAMKPSEVFGLSVVIAFAFAVFALLRGDILSFLCLLYCAWVIFIAWVVARDVQKDTTND